MSFKRVINVTQAHAGEPMEVVTGGVGPLPGKSVYEKMCYLRDHDDDLRKMLLYEPRGYVPKCCNIIVEPCNPEAAAGYIILEPAEYPMMSGGNTIAVATVLLENGIIPMREPYTDFKLEAPIGMIDIHAKCHNGKCTQVTFKNQPSMVAYLDEEIEIPEYGKVKVDVAWGGMWYVMADISQFPGVELIPAHGGAMSSIMARLVKAANTQLPPIRHPDFPDVPIMSGMLTGRTDRPDADAKNQVAMSTGEIDLDAPETWKMSLDRCPCGTGTCARMAALWAKGELKLHERFRHENSLGLIFTGELVGEAKIGDKDAVIPTVGGEAWIYGYNTYVLDETDPFPAGFRIGDIWPMKSRP